MEAALLYDSWTRAVPWARPWQPCAAQRDIATVVSFRPPLAAAIDAATEAEWRAAVAALASARADLAAEATSDDPWPEMMARHAVHLAMRRVRATQRLMGGDDAQWVT